MIYKTLEIVDIIINRLETAYSRQKSYADNRMRKLEIEKGDKVYLKTSPMKGVVRFGKTGKLSHRIVGRYEIIQSVGEVSYRL